MIFPIVAIVVLAGSPPAPPDQVAAAAALIARIVGPVRSVDFKLKLTDANTSAVDSFSVEAGRCCTITGTNGVALASGFNWYLRYVGKQQLLPVRCSHVYVHTSIHLEAF